MQLAGFHDLVELPAQTHQLFVDGAAVRLDLRLAGTADETKPAPLPFQVGPGPHQPCALVGQCRHLDLQHTFAGGGAIREDLQDQTGAVQQLDPPFLF